MQIKLTDVALVPHLLVHHPCLHPFGSDENPAGLFGASLEEPEKCQLEKHSSAIRDTVLFFLFVFNSAEEAKENETFFPFL